MNCVVAPSNRFLLFYFSADQLTGSLEKDETFIIFHAAVVGFVGDNMNGTEATTPHLRLAEKRVSHKLRLYFIGIRRSSQLSSIGGAVGMGNYNKKCKRRTRYRIIQ